MPDIRSDPKFRTGFNDARGGIPLYNRADKIYAAGWRAYWVCVENIKHLRNASGSDDAGNIRSSFG